MQANVQFTCREIYANRSRCGEQNCCRQGWSNQVDALAMHKEWVQRETTPSPSALLGESGDFQFYR